MDGVLEEMRRGIERMQQSRMAAQEAVQATLDAHGVAGVSDLPPAARQTVKVRSKYGAALRVLNRLSASYRRCSWKSGSQIVFPMFNGHLTYASHKCWTVFIKKAVFPSRRSLAPARRCGTRR